MEIKLGDKVKDRYTGFTGIATSKTEFINGCVQVGVSAKVGKDNKIPEDVGIDQQSLEVLKPKKKKVIKENTGGRNNLVPKMRGF